MLDQVIQANFNDFPKITLIVLQLLVESPDFQQLLPPVVERLNNRSVRFPPESLDSSKHE